jgi:HEAT repeats
MISASDLEQLIQTLQDDDPSVQSEAEDQLRKNIFDKGLDSSLGDSLIQALKDSDSEVRMRAIEYLRRFLAQSALQKEQSRKIQLQFW